MVGVVGYDIGMMNQMELIGRLGVCSWSLQAESAGKLRDGLGAIDLHRVQLGLDAVREDGKNWGDVEKVLEVGGIRIVSGMFVTIGEDYSSLESIRRTGGVVPDQHWEMNWKAIRENAVIANNLGIEIVTFHAGFLPHDKSDRDFIKLLNRIAMIADFYGERGLRLGFETGQETADTLVEFLEELNRPNVGVNFDPANMILYDKGDPIQALRLLGKYVIQCHVKDAVRTKSPGTWGEEVAVGTGEVEWKSFFEVLDEIGFKGELFLEREAGSQRIVDIRSGRDYVAGLFPAA
jgi:L-ribulose-5-phosphate 3-epimerase